MKQTDKKIIKDLGDVAVVPEHLRINTKDARGDYLGTKAILKRCEAIASVGDKEYSFPFTMVVPRANAHSVVIYLRQREPLSADLPIEMLVDAGILLLILEEDDIEANGRHRQGIFKCGRSIFKRAKKIAWCLERLVDVAICIEESDALPISLVGCGNGCLSLLSFALNDDRTDKIFLVMPSLMDSAESEHLYKISGSIARDLIAKDVVVIEPRILTENSRISRILPCSDISHISVTKRHLGTDAWAAIIGEL